MKDYPGAITAFNKAIAVDPNYAPAYNNRGVYQLEQGKKEDAKKDFEKALQLNPKYAAAADNLSAIYFKQKDYKKAFEFANNAITYDPNYAGAYVNRGIAKEMLRDMEGACNDWHKAEELGAELGKKYHSENCNN